MTLASTAYQNALEYVKARVQGRDIAGRKSGDVPIIDHPDVRRMLLWMKAMVEGMRSMIYTGAFWQDHALELPPGEQRQHYADLLDFLTPIIKAYCSDMGFRVCETAIQCLGGYGYCKEYPLEQYLRDAKIMSLYEGTNGIQSMDLMSRKMRIPWRLRKLRCERAGRLLRCRKGRFEFGSGNAGCGTKGQRTEVRGQKSEVRGRMTVY